jgi:hypothetical protein
MYHFLTGVRPPERAEEVVSISVLGRYGAGIARVIERSMKLDPAQRFKSAPELAAAIRKIRNK